MIDSDLVIRHAYVFPATGMEACSILSCDCDSLPDQPQTLLPSRSDMCGPNP